jgi:4-amino-4-deoxy-L-arabinose transferase-like glycosyltransferase
VFTGAALLLKGPVLAPFLVASALAIAWVERPPARRLLAALAVLLAVGCALAAPWCALVVERVGWRTAWDTLRSEGIERVTATVPINAGPLYFYVPHVALGFMPWTWLSLVWASRDFRAHVRRPAAPSSCVRVSGLFALLALAAFSLFAGKEPKYLLPIYPFLALVAGVALDWAVRARTTAAERIAVLGLGAAGLIGVAGLALPRTDLAPWMAALGRTGQAAWLGGVVLAAAGLLLLLLAGRGRRQHAAAVLAVGLTLTVVTVQGAIKMRGNALKSPRPVLADLERARAAGLEVYRFRVGRVGTHAFRAHTIRMDDETPGDALPRGATVEYAVATTREGAAALLGALDRPTEIVSVTERAGGRYVLLVARSREAMASAGREPRPPSP